MSDPASDSDGRSATDSKVGRVIEEYGLSGAGAELERRWIAEEGGRSLRDLAAWFNRKMVRAALQSAGEDPLEGEVTNIYRLLTDDDVTGGTRLQTRKTLERSGVDVDALESNFVSHQAVHTYLTKFRGVDYPDDDPDDGERIANASETIQRLKSRTEVVTESTLEQLARNDRVTLGSADVIVDVQVACEDCGTVARVEELLADGGCDCER